MTWTRGRFIRINFGRSQPSPDATKVGRAITYRLCGMRQLLAQLAMCLRERCSYYWWPSARCRLRGNLPKVQRVLSETQVHGAVQREVNLVRQARMPGSIKQCKHWYIWRNLCISVSCAVGRLRAKRPASHHKHESSRNALTSLH